MKKLILPLIGLSLCLTGCGAAEYPLDVSFDTFSFTYKAPTSYEEIPLQENWTLAGVIKVYSAVENESDYQDSLLIGKTALDGMALSTFVQGNINKLVQEGLVLEGETMEKFALVCEDVSSHQAILKYYALVGGQEPSAPNPLYVVEETIDLGDGEVDMVSFTTDTQKVQKNFINQIKSLQCK